MNKKVRILVIPSDTAGCGFYRSLQPHRYIKEHYSDYFDIDIMYQLPQTTELDKFLRNYDILHIHKQLDADGIIVQLAQFLGVKVIVDVDDHWDLGLYHPMSITAKKEKWYVPIIKHLKMADYCTTTTPIFAKEIKQYNKNVLVFPNAIDPNEKQFIPQEKKSKRIRFGIICGSSHLNDIKLLEDMTKKLPQEIIDKVQFVLCGFDTRGSKTMFFEDGRKETRPILPQESVWYDYEKIITDNYRICSEDQKEFLHKFIRGEYGNDDVAYRRCWTKPIDEYATHYNDIDVLLVPLKECEFNKVKSQLKVIEAGFFKKAIIAQNFGPYTIDLKPMVEKGGKINEDGNALLVDSSKNHKDWVKYITMLVNNPDMIKKLQENLYNTVKDKYSLETVGRNRAQKYLEICGITDVVLK